MFYPGKKLSGTIYQTAYRVVGMKFSREFSFAHCPFLSFAGINFANFRRWE